MAVSFKSALLPLAVAMALSFGVVGAATADTLTENFDNGVPANWTIQNLSDPVGNTSWFQGEPAVFASHEGAANSYAAANFRSGSGISDLSTWMILPTATYRNGDTLSFFTRTVEQSFNPDSLEVRFSNVGGTDVGATSSSVGTFDTLLLSINPDAEIFGYPDTWTQFSVTLAGLSGDTNGAFAFRYTVPTGGTTGFNSNYIGIDTLSISSAVTAVPEMETYLMMAAGLGLVGWMRKRKSRAAHA